jgi:nitrite reductase/ring-hydroxylating ferredoxin subunit
MWREMDCENCARCPSNPNTGNRREFVTCLLSGVALALTGLGNPSTLLALPISYTESAASGPTQRSFPIPASDGVTIDRASSTIIVRFQNRAYAFALSCPHENTALKWLQKDGRFQCPKHGSKYKPDGTFLEGRATRNMDRFAVTKDNNNLIVDLSKWFQSDKDAAGWSTAFVQL